MKRFCLLLALILCLLLSACGAGGGGSGGSTSGAEYGGAEPGAVNGAGDAATWGTPQQESIGGSGEVYRNENAKIIRTASVDMQTTDFAAAQTALDALVDRLKGYFEQAEVNSGGYYDQGMRYGSFTVRVPKDQYDTFLNAVGEVGHVVSLSQSSQDVGAEYFDTQAHLKTQRTKQERLQTLLAQAATMEDIISLENALAEVEYQIEQMTTQLRKYDALVDYATIHVEVQEVRRISDEPQKADALSTRVSAAFSSGLIRFGEGWGNLLVWLAYHCFSLLILAILAAVVILIVLRVHKKNRAYAMSLQNQPRPAIRTPQLTKTPKTTSPPETPEEPEAKDPKQNP
ncbi:MAG: DUF4349 domain-containing protein [Oscillospiraceae bacterium]|nr:DUF4349 domain-containing protein [Oscillospiraceae bacterium]